MRAVLTVWLVCLGILGLTWFENHSYDDTPLPVTTVDPRWPATPTVSTTVDGRWPVPTYVCRECPYDNGPADPEGDRDYANNQNR